MLVPYGDREALAEALSRVLSDEQLWQQLHERSIQAYQRYFSWDAIAEQFVKALGL
jgi:glycosyltransferase involved in cell wall biosynthesis